MARPAEEATWQGGVGGGHTPVDAAAAAAANKGGAEKRSAPKMPRVFVSAIVDICEKLVKNFKLVTIHGG